jgi:hypothetical protein
VRCDIASVANYVVIEGDTTLGTLGDSDPTYTKNFSTPDYNGEDAVISLMVSGLTAATSSVRVRVNGFDIGEIFPYRYADFNDRDEVAAHKYTQTLVISASILDAVSTNTLEVTAVGFPEASAGNSLDDFALRDIILFYKLDV